MLHVKGFKRVEILIVTVILVALFTILTSGFSNTLHTQRLNQGIEAVAAAFTKARGRTLSSGDASGTGQQFGIHIDQSSSPHRIQVFSTNTYAVGLVTDTFEFPLGVTISACSFPTGSCPGLVNFAFERLTGNVVNHATTNTIWTSSGTITIQSNVLATSTTITILPTGSIKTR